MIRAGSLPVRYPLLLAGLVVGLIGPGRGLAKEEKAVPPGTPVNIIVKPAEPVAPPVTIVLAGRHGHVTPQRCGCTHTGGGNIDIQQPSPDTVIVTMTGLTVAYCTPKGSSAVMLGDLEQCFEIVFDNPKVKKAKLTMEGRVIGVLRSNCKCGTAEYTDANAAIVCGPGNILHIAVPPHTVAGGDNLSVNDHEGPCSVPVGPGKLKLHQTFRIAALAGKGLLGKAPSAEFAPDALDPLWIDYKEPFRGVVKKDFGFQVVIKVADDTPAEEEKPAEPKNGDAKPAEPKNGESKPLDLKPIEDKK